MMKHLKPCIKVLSKKKKKKKRNSASEDWIIETVVKHNIKIFEY